MAKEFKEFDVVYKAYANSFTESEGAIYKIKKRASNIMGWKYVDEIEVWSHAEVRKAVYEVAGFEEWQKFRVSLKGQSTAIKLARLVERYLHIREEIKREVFDSGTCSANHTSYADVSNLVRWEKCRIDNYLGALRRGGLLNADFDIVK